MADRQVILHNVGRNLLVIRHSMGLTQQEFAELLGIPKWSTYYRYEKGQRSLPVELLYRLAKLGWSIDWLLTEGNGRLTKSKIAKFNNKT